MSTRQGEERRRMILEQARGSGHVAVTDIASELDVAAETVRRDLKVLEDHGLVRRTHGGAYPVESAGFESNMARRSESWVAEKKRIATAAVEQLGPAETVFLDEGFTPQLVAEELARSGRSMTVVTASLSGAAALSLSPTIDVIALGGRVRSRTLGTVDHWATSMLAQFVLDVAVIGANGITRDRGLTVPNTAVAAVKAKAMEVSRRKIFVGAHTKFGVTSFCRFAEVSDFESLITDSALSTHEAHRYAALGPQVIRV
ncbi:DeoR family transcriptional regulator [Nakamurella sp. YIM 132087]|uniref:Lactose phosphotransferase system repressor n=1 Tax=Nakamurella alba TaxID=2665158 RepID=A0A7K1FNQ9_9ACTN|nr:DeoR/GlpR family DNA-binding transcription regulator [Nakamurella alba]MTD14424.1 DeoR family transcriptional regulator [Nakamurella alba]